MHPTTVITLGMPLKLSNDISNWERRLMLYFSIYLVVIVSHLFVSRFDFNFWHTDVDSARYMLSALIQGEFAVVALVVTLSIVAVQLAAQSYSARVIEVFRRSPDLWILIGIYGIALFYGLGVLKMIEKANPQVNSLSNFESHILFSYYLGIFAFVALWPYILNTLELLKPSTVINNLSERITKQNILSVVGEGDKSNDNDPIQPIIDIMRSALMRYDYETVRDGSRAITNRANYMFTYENFDDKDEEIISKYIFSHLTRVGRLSSRILDEDSTVEIIKNLQKIAETTSDRKLERATFWSIGALSRIGISAAKQKLDGATWRVAFSLGKVGIAAIEQKLEETIRQVAEALEEVGINTVEQTLKEETLEAIKSLEKMGKHVTIRQIEYSMTRIVEALGKIGAASAKQGFGYATEKAAKAIQEIGNIAIEQKFDITTDRAIDALEEIRKIVAEQKLDIHTTQQIEYYFKKIERGIQQNKTTINLLSV